MNAKRPPTRERPPVAREWDPTDTQALRVKIDLAQETEWRRDVVDKMEAIAKTLGEVRDKSRENETSLGYKVSDTELEALTGKVNLLTERVGTLKHVTWGVLVVFVIAVLLEKKGLL